jgi:hypothetical protein
VLRRPSAWSVILRKEGYFSPATGLRKKFFTATWYNPVGRGSALKNFLRNPAGP